MRLDKLTIKSQEALADALDRAGEAGHPELNSLHLLRSLLEQEGGVVPRLLERLGVPRADIAEAIEIELQKMPHVSGQFGQPGLGNSLQQVINAAQKTAAKRFATGHRPERGSDLRRAREIQPRPDATGARGKLDPVIGRDEEIRRVVIQVLVAPHEKQPRAHRRARRR
jgi:ATP-dependent Clp protease ATP-binding subunit ClpA